MEPPNCESLIKYCRELMNDLVTHSVRKEVHDKNKGTTRVYQEFHARHCKKIIDKIHEVLAKHYGLSETEREFIVSFDESFRLQSA
jgi:hypothetical protein